MRTGRSYLIEIQLIIAKVRRMINALADCGGEVSSRIAVEKYRNPYFKRLVGTCK